MVFGALCGFLALGFSMGTPVWHQDRPLDQTDSGAMNTLKVSLSSPVPYSPNLVLKGTLKVETATPVIYAALNFFSTADKRGFLKIADGPVVKDQDFSIPLRGMAIPKESKGMDPWNPGDSVAKFTVYLKLKEPGSSKVAVQNLRFEEDALASNPPKGSAAGPASSPTRDALFSGSFKLRTEVAGQHPRLFIDGKGLDAIRDRFKKNPDSLVRFLPGDSAKVFSQKPVALQDKENGSQANTLAYLALVHRVTGSTKARDALLAWRPALETFTPVAVNIQSPTTGNKDLNQGAILLNMAILYDLTKGHVPADEEALYRRILVEQARQCYSDFTQMKSYHYEQNHLVIPMCALGVTAMVLADELPEAVKWGVFTRNLLGRSMPALAYDGWFFEGISYWSFTMQHPLSWAVALKRNTGEDLLGDVPFKHLPTYLVHQFLPNNDFAFDFADWGPRVNADGTAQRGYEMPWHTIPTRIFNFIPTLYLQERPHPLLRAFADQYLPRFTNFSPSDSLFMLMGGVEIPAVPVAMVDGPGVPPSHYFDDMDVLHWRSSWADSNAAAFAFKCGPPAGHHIAELYPLYPEWKPGLGHAHPDAGSFILWAKGGFLAGDTGYCAKKTAWHNTLTVDDKGQCDETTVWGAWSGMDYNRMNQIRLTNVWHGPAVAAATAVFDKAYPEDFQLTALRRHLILIGGRFMVVVDEGSSAKDHAWKWYLNGDREPKVIGPQTWAFEAGQGRLVVRNLVEELTARTGPTVVETQLYPGPSRPQTRGAFLELAAQGRNRYRSATAFAVQDMAENPAGFSATQSGPGRVELRQGNESCTVWIGDQADFDGAFAYLLKEGNRVKSMGFLGTKWKNEFGTFSGDGRVGQLLHAPGGN